MGSRSPENSVTHADVLLDAFSVFDSQLTYLRVLCNMHTSSMLCADGHYGMLTASDDFGSVVPVAEGMLRDDSKGIRGFAAGLYAALFQLHGDDSDKCARLLRGLVGQATTASLPPQPAAKVHTPWSTATSSLSLSLGNE